MATTDETTADETARPGPRVRAKVWRRSPRSRPGWSLEVTADATADEVDRVVELALAADRKIAAEAAKPDQGDGQG